MLCTLAKAAILIYEEILLKLCHCLNSKTILKRSKDVSDAALEKLTAVFTTMMTRKKAEVFSGETIKTFV